MHDLHRNHVTNQGELLTQKLLSLTLWVTALITKVRPRPRCINNFFEKLQKLLIH